MRMNKMMMAVAEFALVAGCGRVDSGHTGLRLSWGKVVSEPPGPGLWFCNPIGGSLVVLSATRQRRG